MTPDQIAEIRRLLARARAAGWRFAAEATAAEGERIWEREVDGALQRIFLFEGIVEFDPDWRDLEAKRWALPADRVDQVATVLEMAGALPATPRPSVHPTYTKSYAIDQLTDPEKLRQVAHRMWEAFFAANSQTAHAVGQLFGEACPGCDKTREGHDDSGCDRWQEWQAKVDAGFGSI